MKLSITAEEISDLLSLLEFSALCSDVWLGVGAWETWSGSEMSLCFSILGSSKEESVGTYYNYKLELKASDKIPVGARSTS